MTHSHRHEPHDNHAHAHGASDAHDHGHGHRHDHAHDHSHGGHGHHHHAASARALAWSLALTLLILVAEGVGGWLANSLALLADAGHVLTDAAALGLSLFVLWLARQEGSSAKTYGYLRWEILAALINGVTLVVISIWIVIEAVMRFRHPEPVASGTMLVIAVLGFVVNGGAVWLLHGVREGSLNVRGAYLHVLGDMLASGGTVIAALVLRTTGWLDADPIASLLTTLLIIVGAWRLVKESVDVLLESAPAHIALDTVRGRLASIPGVESIHDLHVWTVTSGMIAMSVHAVVPNAANHQGVLERAHDMLTEMGIQHSTVQLECTEMSERELHLHP